MTKFVKRTCASLKEDAKTLFLDILNRNFDNVATAEIRDVKSGLNELKEVFYTEYISAYEEYKKNQQKKLLGISK